MTAFRLAPACLQNRPFPLMQGKRLPMAVAKRLAACWPAEQGRPQMAHQPVGSGDRFPAQRHPIQPRQIKQGFHRLQACLLQELPHRLTLIIAMLQHDPTTRLQSQGGAGNDFAQAGQTVTFIREGHAWFKTDITLVQMMIVLFDIRRIGNNQVEIALP